MKASAVVAGWTGGRGSGQYRCGRNSARSASSGTSTSRKGTCTDPLPSGSRSWRGSWIQTEPWAAADLAAAGDRAAPRASSAWSMSGWPATFMNCCSASASRSRCGWPLLFAGAPGRCPVPAGSPSGLAGVPAAAEGREARPAAHAAGDAQVRDGRRAGGLGAGAVRPGGSSQPHVPGRA
jgi:hypothetical protein